MNMPTGGPVIVERLRRAKKDFGDCCPKKFGGAAAVEILRDELGKEGINTSKRDVFIKGISSEIDLIVPRKNAKPHLDLLYEPRDVVVALEVKKTGSFGEAGRKKIKDNFSKMSNQSILFAYFTFEDRENYRYRPTKELVGCPCFALAWHKSSDGSLEQVAEGDGWEAFIGFLRKSIAVKEGTNLRC